MTREEAKKILEEYISLDSDVESEYIEAQKVAIKSLEQKQTEKSCNTCGNDYRTCDVWNCCDGDKRYLWIPKQEPRYIVKCAENKEVIDDLIKIISKGGVILTPMPTAITPIYADVLDKIRAEIEHLTYYWCEVNPRTVIDDVLQIIDKYREGEE